MKKKVIAVFGGSFNPPINSHLIIAKQIIDKFEEIEKFIFVPVSTKYRKLELVQDNHRYTMLKLMCKNEEKIEVSDIELKQNRQLYTIETLDLLKQEYGKEYEIWFVMGADNLKELHTWKNPEQILEKYKLLVLERGEEKVEDIILNSKLLNKNKSSIILARDIERINLSSTMIREKLRNKENVEQYMPETVLKYIHDNELYR